MTEEEYWYKFEEISNRFSPGFVESIRLNPHAQAIIEALIRGANEYRMLEQAIESIESLSQQLADIRLKQKPTYIITTEERMNQIRDAIKPKENGRNV